MWVILALTLVGGGVILLVVCAYELFLFFCVQFLPVYNPSQEEIDDPKLFANNVRQIMAEYVVHLHVPELAH